jgi:hypothetical protein
VGSNGSLRFDADVAIEIVIAVFHRLDESDYRFI